MVDPKKNLLLDPEMRAPHTDEYSIGVDREVGRRLAVAIAYVRKDGADFIGWTDVGGQYREGTQRCRTAARVPVFVLVNAHGRSTRFLLTNPDGYSLTYNGLVTGRRKTPRPTAGRRLARTRSREASGLQASSGTTAAGAQSQHRGAPKRCRSGAIPTISPTRAAGCQTIARTCSA